MSEKDQGNLLAIVDACDKIQHFTAHLDTADAFFEDIKTFDAVLMNFVVIGEAVNRLSEKLQSHYSHIPWAKIIGFRNIVAHDYFGVDAEEVWEIIQKQIPQLRIDINNIFR